MTSQQNIYYDLPPNLLKAGVDLESQGVAEVAFPAPLAGEVLRHLARRRLRVLGGDLWVASPKGTSLDPGYENWYVDMDADLEQSYQEARNFIRRVENDDKAHVTFVLAED